MRTPKDPNQSARERECAARTLAAAVEMGAWCNAEALRRRVQMPLLRAWDNDAVWLAYIVLALEAQS